MEITLEQEPGFATLSGKNRVPDVNITDTQNVVAFFAEV